MSNSYASFKVNTRLASILGESYRSTELALKELVDNSWDADAENVWITLPEPLTKNPIIIKDDGSGMTEKQIIIRHGKVNKNIDTRYVRDSIKPLTFNGLISNARHQIKWLLAELQKGN